MPLELMITQAGLDALVDAQNGETDVIEVTQVGVTAAAFTMAPTITAIPAEIKRLSAVSGESVSETIIHMTAQDPSATTYDVRGLGLYLADGTLFAVYSQAALIFTKVSAATFLLALDIAFSSPVSGAIVFGSTSFLLPPASETVKGVAEIATQAEASAGTDDERIVTAKKLKVLLDALSTALGVDIAALLARTITGAGLVTGGGNLSANRTLTVTAASAGEVAAASANDKAVTPLAMAAIVSGIAALVARTIGGTGLVSGGGDLSANRTLNVTAASAGDVTTGTATDRAVTPAALSGLARSLVANGYAVLPGCGGLMLQWGRMLSPANSLASALFPVAFPSACFAVVPAGGRNGGSGSQENAAVLIDDLVSATGFSVYSADDEAAYLRYIAVGI